MSQSYRTASLEALKQRSLAEGSGGLPGNHPAEAGSESSSLTDPPADIDTQAPPFSIKRVSDQGTVQSMPIPVALNINSEKTKQLRRLCGRILRGRFRGPAGIENGESISHLALSRYTDPAGAALDFNFVAPTTASNEPASAATTAGQPLPGRGERKHVFASVLNENLETRGRDHRPLDDSILREVSDNFLSVLYYTDEGIKDDRRERARTLSRVKALGGWSQQDPRRTRDILDMEDGTQRILTVGEGAFSTSRTNLERVNAQQSEKDGRSGAEVKRRKMKVDPDSSDGEPEGSNNTAPPTKSGIKVEDPDPYRMETDDEPDASSSSEDSADDYKPGK